MTICIAWLRKTPTTEELLIATDSRLRSVGAWDANPKIFPLPRNDSFITFCGDTHYAYPMIIQLINAINNHPKSKQRFQDLTEFKGFVVRCFNDLLVYRSEMIKGQIIPDAQFILGGYSWIYSKFFIWNIQYQKDIDSFTSHRAIFWKGIKTQRKIMFIGDYVDQAKQKFIEILKKRNKLISGELDYEPFEVLSDMLKNSKIGSKVGGSPQLLKVYRHMNAIPFAVKWKVNNIERITLLGRPLSQAEALHHPLIDPSSMVITNQLRLEDITD